VKNPDPDDPNRIKSRKRAAIERLSGSEKAKEKFSKELKTAWL
jgi:hypothetical protein